MRVTLVSGLVLAFVTVAASPQNRPPSAEARLAAAVDQLRHTQARWTVTTDFLQPDGSVARRVQGTYQFDWVVRDRVLSGRSAIPELQQASGILFYVNEKTGTIEMASVGADGTLWVMTGKAGDEVRTTPPVMGADGRAVQRRFTRYNITHARFESKMEYTHDRGRTWQPGNHQTFLRAR